MAPSPAVVAARARPAGAQGAADARIEWFIEEVKEKINLTLEQRVRLATEFLRSKVVSNISRPVTKGAGPRGGRVVTGRSLPGEYPRADTTLLMKTIFGEVKTPGPGIVEGYVGTPLDYGLTLEILMDRSFLKRTLNEQLATIRTIITQPRIQ